MIYKMYQIDAFTNKIFHGNQACVVSLTKWLPDSVMLQIAKENAVSETAFFIDKGQYVQLRWFTPDLEIDLCGHATLATAYVLKTILKYPLEEIVFKTKSGLLTVTYRNNLFYLNFPSRIAVPSSLPKEIMSALNIKPKKVFKSRDFLLVYESQNDIEKIKINRNLFDTINLGYGGVIVTAKGNSVDFVSRFFTPQATILEDSVTGSAHCTLIPYWSSVLLKDDLSALQLSERGGRLLCKNLNERVIIGGEAVCFSTSEFTL